MKNNLKSVLIPLLFLLFNICLAKQYTSHKSHPKLKKTEEYILTNQPDSALILLNQIKDTTYNTYITFLKTNILKQQITYEHLKTFLLTIHNRREINPKLFKQFKQFKHISIPESNSEPDHDYILLMGIYLNILADHGYLEEAAKVYETFNTYIEQFDKTNEIVKKAQFKMNTYNGLMACINNDLDKAETFYKKNIEIGQNYAQHENYDLLIESYSGYLVLLTRKRDTEGYINTCRKVINLYKTLIKKKQISSINLTPIESLINALIFQDYKTHQKNNIEEIKTLIKLAHNQPNVDPYFDLIYINLFRILDEHSSDAKDIFDEFNVKDLSEFCAFIVQKIEENESELNLYNTLHTVTLVLQTKEYYKEALKYSMKMVKLREKIYSEDLTNQLAEHKSRDEKKKRNLTEALLTAKTERDNYIFIALAIVILSIVVISRIQFQKNKILKVKNKEKQFFIEEINHRVKNNFQIASAYLHIQFSAFKNKDIDLLIKQWNSKIKSIIAVHQYLYQNDTLKINVKHYADGVIQEVLNIYPEIDYKLNINISSGLELYNNTAVKIGLIINELLTNAVKHGVTKNNTLNITITITQLSSEGYYQIKYSDSGMKTGFNLDQVKETSFGYRLIENLCSHIDGSLSFSEQEESIYIVFKNAMQYD